MFHFMDKETESRPEVGAKAVPAHPCPNLLPPLTHRREKTQGVAPGCQVGVGGGNR
jgi:hypothetical protein